LFSAITLNDAHLVVTTGSCSGISDIPRTTSARDH
jgi:hypothetical protein